MTDKKNNKTYILQNDTNNNHNVNIPIQNDKNLNTLTKKELSDLIYDLSEDITIRLKTVDFFLEKYKAEETLEIINKLSTMYQFSGTKLLEKYLSEMCKNTNLPHYMKISIAKSLCYFNIEKESSFDILNLVCKNINNKNNSVSTPCHVEVVCLLMLSKKYKIQAKNYFCSIINDKNIDCDYRYKTILSLEKNNISNYLYFMTESTLEFFNNNSNMSYYRILAGQNLLQKCNLDENIKLEIETTLLSFSQDENLDYNLRADASDVILRLGSDGNKLIARDIILILGRQETKVKTIFDNAQNVHTDEIEESVIEILEFLSTIETQKTNKSIIDFNYIKKQIKDILENTKPQPDKKIVEKINISLNRIYMDRALYSKYKFSLLNILIKIWIYISQHISQNELKLRLIQELEEMSGTCSSGFAGRLCNVISGFSDFNLKISWKDQIAANLKGRLNHKIKNITNTGSLKENSILYKIDTSQNSSLETIKNKLNSFQENVLLEMSEDTYKYSKRSNFLLFFRKNIIDIKLELEKEFIEYISVTDFELHFRTAISSYETGEKII